MSRPGKIVALASAVIALGAVYAVAQQSPAAGLYTTAEAAAGHDEYAVNCAGCHAANLMGVGEGPAITGTGFMSSWGNRTIKELYDFVSASMPYGNAGNLGEKTYTDIIAFILQQNGVKAGAQGFDKNATMRIANVATGQPTPVQQAAAAPASAPVAGRGSAAAPAPGRGQAAAAPARGGRAARDPQQGLTVAGIVKDYTPVTDEMLVHPSDDDWPMFRRNYQGWSYSPLDQINTRNVKTLQLKWAWAMNEGGASEVTPIVHSGVIFLSNTSNTIQALDAKTGELIWENRIGPDTSNTAYMATRSLALYQDKLYVAATDAKLYALDARTGKILWESDIGEQGKGETGGVMVMHGKVLVGLMDCDNYSTSHCYISAFDATTGQRDWKFYTSALTGTPGGDTWNNLPDDLRGGTDTWIAGTYDPDLNTTYWGVAQAKPWMRASRKTYGQAALFSSSTLALDPDTGKLKWYFQHIPGELLDLDEVFERVLIDHGDQKTVMSIGKTGILWKLDRVTGKFLAAKETMFQNVFSKLDPKTGALIYRSDILNQKTNEWLSSCPGPEGGHDWPATSYNAPTDLLVIPLSQSCVLMEGHDVDMKVGGGGTAASQLFYFMPGTHQNMGKLVAYRTSDMTQAWSFQQRSPFLTAVLSTGGGVAFVGDFDRNFKAVDVRTGKILWQTRLGTTAQGYPVSFRLAGKQYIAVTAGLGGGSPEQKPTTLLTDVHRPSTGQQLYVFALPDAD